MKKWITFGLALLFLGLGLWIAGRAARQQTLVYYEDQPTTAATTTLNTAISAMTSTRDKP